MFFRPGGGLETGGVTQTRNGATATLVVNSSNVDSFQNRDLYCTNAATDYSYLFISSASKYMQMCAKHHLKGRFKNITLILAN